MTVQEEMTGMPDLSGKTFIITGGNGGIGLGMAEGIAAAGAGVAIWGRKEEKNAEALEKLKAYGTPAFAYVCDVSDEIDGLFANAGRGGVGKKFVDMTLEDWRAVMAVNLDGVFLTLREAARVLIEQGEGGSLVAVSSTSAIHGAAGNEAYGTAKTGLNGLVRALAVAFARYGIRVNSLLPGWTKTDLAMSSYQSEKFRTVTTNRTPVRRWADPAEFREIGAFLADPSLTFHTGQEVCVDGGYTVF
jgi:NAD(P)-dependent dehydrogenase (short-subunit alcohol dehydrogenase family)